jgi:hypothetical protein
MPLTNLNAQSKLNWMTALRTPCRLFLATLGTVLFISICSESPAQAQAPGDYHTFGIMGGIDFPKTLVGKLQLNFAQHWGIDYQPSLGIFWTIQQADLTYFFWRSDWSPSIGAGIQRWNFTGFNAPSNFNGIPFSASNATSVTFPLGLQFVSEGGFALDLEIAADIFVDAPLDLKGKVVPEGGVLLGYFF